MIDSSNQYGLKYALERWYALASLYPAEKHATLWEVYAGSVAVGLTVASHATAEEHQALIQWLGSKQPPQVQ